MSASFSVLNDGWIPVITADGKMELLGIRETLRRAPELREISDPSPLSEFSIYRFLGVFLMDALRPERERELRDIRKQGRFNTERIEAYIARCMSEGVTFDLFSEKRPFLQSEYDKKYEKEPKPAAALDCMQASGNNHTHFCHGSADPVFLSAAQCAVLLLAQSLFCTAAAQGYPSGVNASPPYFMIVNGASLFETLTNLLIPISNISIPFDAPPVIWRDPNPTIPKKEVSETSWLRGMLFPTRRILLLPNEDGKTVSSIYLSQGENYVNKEAWTDPAVSYRQIKTGIVPFRPKHENPVWRNYYDVANVPGGLAAQILSLYLRISGNEEATVTLYGAETVPARASYVSVMRHTLTVSRALAESGSKIELLHSCVDRAEELARALRHSLTDTAILKDNIADLAENAYFAACERLFWQMCEELKKASEEELEALYGNWLRDIGGLAVKANEDAVIALHLRGRALAAVAQKQRWLKFIIKKQKEALE